MTVTWHIDDIKASHKDSAEVTKLIISLSGIYGNGLKVTQGKVHSYFGMDFDCTTNSDLKQESL